MRSGIIIFQAKYGRLTHNTDWLGTMNPYVIVRMGDQKVKTEPAKNMHLTPRWTSQLNLVYRNETHMQIEVKSKELLKDRLIGTGTIDLTKWQQKGIQKYSEWVPLFYKQVQAGAILVEMYFQRDQALGPMEAVIQKEIIPNLNSLTLAGVENRHIAEAEHKPMPILSLPHNHISSSDYHQIPYNPQERHGQVMGEQPVMAQSTNVVYYSKTGSFGDDPRLYKSENISHQVNAQQNPVYTDKIITPLRDGSVLVAPKIRQYAEAVDNSYHSENIPHQGPIQQNPVYADKIITPLRDGSMLVAPKDRKSGEVIDTSYHTNLAGRPTVISSGFPRRSVNTQAQPEPNVQLQQQLQQQNKQSVIESKQPVRQQPVYQTTITSVRTSTVQKGGGNTLSQVLEKRGYRVYDPEQHGPRLGMIFDDEE
jgi:C2 domain.